MNALQHRGVLAALAAALLFGAGTPVAKVLLGTTSPLVLAGLLYLGSGVGLAAWRLLRRSGRVRLERRNAAWLMGAVLAGGAVGPALLMWGLASLPASAAALLLNGEGVFTALLAWYLFKEAFDRRIAFGMLLIVVGAVVLSWPGEARFGALLPSLAVLGACFAWAIDNNLTRKVSLTDATYIAMIKGVVAGTANLLLALATGASLPAFATVIGAGALGLVSYGVSLVLFVVALRDLGTARTGAYFSTAPFAGAVLAVLLLREPLTLQLVLAGVLMAAGVWIHLSEQHRHVHVHRPVRHQHEHEHDIHHQHAHAPELPAGTRHSHAHEHQLLEHEHEHYPDAHHRHEHS